MPRPMKHERSIAMYETILKLRTVEECVDFFDGPSAPPRN